MIEISHQIVQLAANLVYAIDRIEYGSECPTDRNIVTVLFPVEVAAYRPPKILEIRNMISQLIRGRRHVTCVADRAMIRFDYLLHQGIHPLHVVDRFPDLVGLLEQVIYAVSLTRRFP